MRHNYYTFGHLPYTWITEHPPTSAIVVWALLQDHRNSEGVSWPSLQRMERLSGLSRSSLQRGVKWLLDGKYIVVAKGGGKASSCYRIIWDSNKLPEDYVDRYEKNIARGVAKTTPPGIKNETHPVAKMTPEDNTNKVNAIEDNYIDTLLEAYNAVCDEKREDLPGWKKARKTNDPKRKRAVQRLWEATGSKDAAIKHFKRALQNAHWQGANGWRADLSFFGRPARITEVQEMDESGGLNIPRAVKEGLRRSEEMGGYKVTISEGALVQSFDLLIRLGFKVPDNSSLEHTARYWGQALSGSIPSSHLVSAVTEWAYDAKGNRWPKPAEIINAARRI